MSETVTLDGGNMTSVKGTHRYLKQSLGFPDYYGMNLDALWDVLSTASEPVCIRLTNIEKAKQCLGGYADAVIEVFVEAAKNNPNIQLQVD